MHPNVEYYVIQVAPSGIADVTFKLLNELDRARARKRDEDQLPS